MKRLNILLAASALIVLIAALDSFARGRGGFRAGGRVGGARVGGYRGGAAGGYRSAAGVGAYGGSATRTRGGGTVVGPGGSASRRYGSGSVTTPRGGSVQYGGASTRRTGAFGGTAGRHVGGVQVTTPGRRTATKVGTAGGAVGPGGRAVGGRTTVGGVSGQYGSAAGVSRSGGAIGPRGAVGGGYRGGVAVGAHGAVAGGSRYGVATGRAGYRGGTVRRSTYHVSSTTLRTRGTYVRTGFRHYSCFTPTWYARYPRAWRAARWTTASVWVPATWSTVYTYCSFPPTPIYYDYGSAVVYQDNRVYMNGEPAATAEQYSQQAEQIASAGQAAQPAQNDEWQPLGVFAMVQGDEQTSYHIFQIAVNKKGLLRGNYFNALTDSSEPLVGSVDQKTQRAAWTVGNRKTPVYEAGIANLTKEETTMLVHFSSDNTQQMTLVRVKQQERQAP